MIWEKFEKTKSGSLLEIAGVTPPRPAPMPEQPFWRKLNVLNVTLGIFVVAVVSSLPAVRGADRKMDYFGNFVRFVERFFPPDFSVFEEVWEGLLESIQMAVVATAMAILASLPLAVAGARTISPIWLVGIARMGLNIIRTVPGLVWALFAVAIFGANALAGVVGLAVYSVGYLGKFFSDALESVDMDAAVGLRAMGAHPLQAFQYGLWPYVKPLVWSYSLWMLEYNIRSASIIGYVGAGGVGLLLFTYQQYYQWDKFCTALLSILVLVTVLDLVGEWARKKVAKRVYRPLGSK